jgi:hypothetical protein
MDPMDDPQRQIDHVEKRTRRYWLDDGVTEIAAGLAFLIVALYLLAEHALRGTPRGGLFSIAFPILVIVLAAAGQRAVRAVKDRYVHPRTGFVSFARPHAPIWARVAAALLAFLIAMLIVLFASHAPALRNWIPALEGGILAAGFLFASRQADIVRFPVEGLLCAVGGILLSMMPLSFEVAVALLFAWLGAVLISGGLIGFVGYLRRVPPPEEA